MLAFVAPLLPTLAQTPPAGDDWLHEIKHDGFRTIVAVEHGRARAFSRNGHDWSDRYRPVTTAAAALACRSALLDGEMVVQTADGRSDIAALQAAVSGYRRKAVPEPNLVFYAFDLIHLDGADLRGCRLEERRDALAELLPADATRPILFSEALVGDGAKILAAADRLGLEGVVSKRAGSRYASGRSKAWLKSKNMTEGEFVVVGMEPNPGGPPFALLARESESGLSYVGSAFVTLPQPARNEFWTRAQALRIDNPPVRGIARREAAFVRPSLRVRAKYLKGEGLLRHASLTGLA